MVAACISDYRELARRRLPQLLFDYIDGGAYAERTLARNVADFADVLLRQRVMRDVSAIDLSTELFGQACAMPVALSPVGLAGMYRRRGEVQAARAAASAGVPFCLSTMSLCALDEVAAGAGPVWFQLYMIRDRGYMAELLAEAGRVACPVLVFTVDLPVPGVRYRDVRSGASGGGLAAKARTALDGLTHPAWLWDVKVRGGELTFGNLAAAIPEARGLNDFWSWVGSNFDPTITWADLEWVRARWKGPIVIKGVLDPDDARAAVDAGADGISVSNHGGRQLDSVPSAIAALPAIVDAVGDRTTVLMDGGVRSGLDVVKALALGAKGCLIGRAWAWALAARGEAGVSHVLEILRGEMQVAMALTGCTDVRAVSREVLAGRDPR
jgi:L-lactate dehydrogenase (cytochrome)